ncbi:MAG: hypothetical protein JW803_05100 [Endomicrobiales bacterium]|nr:hypothetical protein [Endomicrobiales bacterium]
MKYLGSPRTLASALALVLLCRIIALSGSGASTVSFLKINPDPQSEALGGSVLSLSATPTEIPVNPALSAYIYQTKFAFSNTSLVSDVEHMHGGAALPTEIGHFGIGVTNIGYGTMKGYAVDASEYSIPESNEMAVVLNYSRAFRRSVPVYRDWGAVGANLKFVRSTLVDYSSDAIALDVGGILKVPGAKGLSAALVFSNIGQGPSFVKESNPLPLSTDVGLRYDKPEWKDVFGVVNLKNDSDATAFSVGAGVSPFYPAKVWCGWKESEKAVDSGLRFGMGLNIGYINFSYSYVFYKDFSPVHRIGIDMELGGFSEPKIAYDYYLNYYFHKAKQKYNRGDYLAARRLFSDILSVYPNHEASKDYLERIAFELDKIEQQKMVETDRLLRRAEVALLRDNIILAKKYYTRVLDVDPENQRAREGMDRIDERLGDYSSIEAQRRNRAKLNVLWEDGYTAYEKGDYVTAKEKFQQILILDPENAEVARYLSEVHDQISKVSSLQTEALYQKGVELFDKGDFEEAAKYFGAVSVADPAREDAKHYLAESEKRIAEKERRAASGETEKTAKEKREVESVYYDAFKLFENEDYEKAIRGFTKSRELASKYGLKKYADDSANYITAAKSGAANKYYRFGVENEKKKDEEAAYEFYQKALEFNRSHMEARQAASRLSDDLSQAYYESGMKYYSKGNMRKAREYFKKSLYYKPGKLESLRALERIK